MDNKLILRFILMLINSSFRQLYSDLSKKPTSVVNYLFYLNVYSFLQVIGNNIVNYPYERMKDFVPQ